MLDYVINLLNDATDFSWSSAKASHVVLLCCMEQGEKAGWVDIKKIDRVSRAYVERHSVGQNSTQRLQDKGLNSGKSFPCVYFIEGVCLQRQTHENKGVIYKHICSHCWNKEAKAFQPLQVECRKAQNNIKNDFNK